MHLKKTTSAGVVTFIEGEIQVTLNSTGRITDVTYGVTPTTVAAIAQYVVGSNDLWEYGVLDSKFFNTYFSNR